MAALSWRKRLTSPTEARKIAISSSLSAFFVFMVLSCGAGEHLLLKAREICPHLGV
jgi:hypothetical protein